MGAPSKYFVDPVNGIDAVASGTILNPWRSCQFALNTITQDTADGDKINLRDTGPDILSGVLDLGIYGLPVGTSPLTFRGYTLTEDDGGIGEISGSGTFGVFGPAKTGVSFIDMHCHDSGGVVVLTLGSECRVINTEVDNSTEGALTISNGAFVERSYFHNVANAGILGTNGCFRHCVFQNGVNKPTFWVLGGIGLAFDSCLFDIDGTTEGIRPADAMVMTNNIFFGNASAAKGIRTSADRDGLVILNNIFVGFSATGGIGLNLRTGDNLQVVGNNAFFDNDTDSTNATGQHFGDDNEVLASDPFVDAAGGNFTPVDIGNVLGGGFPSGFLGSALTQYSINKGISQDAGVSAAPAVAVTAIQGLVDWDTLGG